MGLLSLTYRRPQFVEDASLQDSASSIGDRTDGSVHSGYSARSAGIPDSLAFDKIINGGTCPPCTVRDFMNYLIYVEHSAENLQFYLWLKDYSKRFDEAQTADMALAPVWTQEMEDEVLARVQKEKATRMRQEESGAEIFRGTDFEKKMKKPDPVLAAVKSANSNPFNTPPRTADGNDHDNESVAMSQPVSTQGTYKSLASEAFASAGAKAPFTIQPFREEIDRIVATYISEGAPRQLNISGRERIAALHGLAYTTHPSALRQVFKAVDFSLRHQAHPNFIRWSICNGNPARVFFARFLGIFLIVGSFVAALLLTLSSVPRGYRAIPAIGFVLGISTLIAAWKGMCVVLHGMHHHHVRPWELFVDEESEKERTKDSFESFGSSNSYEDEPWIVKYQKRNVVRKVFDREVWIQEPVLRQIQDTIFVQSMIGAVLLGGVVTAIFVAVPGGNFF